MDEDDSQDELINRNASHSKAKRAAVWDISDDSDDVEEESDEGESESSEEEEVEDCVNGDDDEEEEEEGEEEDEEEEEDAKPEDGAFGGTSADLAGLSSDEDSDKCPICLNSFNSQPVATPESCEHYFCFDCILEWAKNANSCPVDRIAFNSIYLRKCYGGKVKKMITVQKPVKEGQEETVDLDLEQTNCEVCGSSDREDRLLLCDGCDAGYHMECLTPPLNSVPVEEWFCPDCVANNRHLRGSGEEQSDAESLPSTARPATSRPQPWAAGPTRAIARTQQSERVRANVNRHRISQARSSQLAPTYLIQSTWLDDTINAVVAGLNTAVYVRDFTPRVPSGRRRRKRKTVRSKKTSSAKAKKGTTSTGVKKRKQKVRRTKSRRKTAMKKKATPRSRIAKSLGMVKAKKGSSLPAVYQPSEHTLSNMRADIGAASLSIYGDPYDLDPFADREEEEQQAHVTSLLEAKRRGISRSALRSHQPVARPVTASLSRRGMAAPLSEGLVEAAPVPDLLGSILSGQSMLMMDSSDIVISRDGSLKTTKPMAQSPSVPGCSKSFSSGEASSPGLSPNIGDGSLSFHDNEVLLGSSSRFVMSQSSSRLPSFTAPPPSLAQPTPPSGLPSRRHPSLLPPRPDRHSSVHPNPDISTKSNGRVPSQSHPVKTPVKPMWVDVSVLPRIPKIKRDDSSVTNEGSSGGSKVGSSRRNSNDSSVSNVYGMPETGVNSLSGDKGRQQSVDQQKTQVGGQTQRHRSDEASSSSSSSFSNSFSSASGSSSSFSSSASSSSSSSSSSAYPSSQSRYSSTASSSSSVSFRINSSGNSWQSRRLSIASSSTSGGTSQQHCREKEDEARKRQLRRDKQMLLASRTGSKEEDNDIYDPFNPTLSDSSGSGDEAESTSPMRSSQSTAHEERTPNVGNRQTIVQSKWNRGQIKTEPRETEVSREESRTAQKIEPQQVRRSQDFVKLEKESRTLNTKREKPTFLFDIKIKKEPPLSDEEESETCDSSINSCTNPKPADRKLPACHSQESLKTERGIKEEDNGQCTTTQNRSLPNNKHESLASSSATTKNKVKEETKTDSTFSSKSPSHNLPEKKKPSKPSKEEPKSAASSTSKSLSEDSHQKKKPSKPSKEQSSSSSETDRSRRGDHHASDRGGGRKERDKERSSRRSSSREKRRARSTSSDSSQHGSPDRERIKRRRSRSRSNEDTRRKRSRSGSSSSSRERSHKKKRRQRSKEKDDGRERDHGRRRESNDKMRGRPRSKSQSKSRSRSRSRSRSSDRKRSRSRSRSRSRERRKERSRLQQSSHSTRVKVESRSKDKRRPRSRSSSRERRKEAGSSRTSQKPSVSAVSSSKDAKQLPSKKKEKHVTQNVIREERVSKVKKQAPPSCAPTVKVKKEPVDLGYESKVSDTIKEMTHVKKIKKEKQPSLDMFEDSLNTQLIKSEETNIISTTLTNSNEEETKKPLKTEPCEIPMIKTEPDTPELCNVPPINPISTVTIPVKTECGQDPVSESVPASKSCKTQQTTELSVTVKEETRQPSDSEDDFNVDVMLDNLDYVTSEHTEKSGAAVKQEKTAVVSEAKNEVEHVSNLAGSKSKTQVKRVTWNIQEPEGPQPEKTASKLALYKLKLKQEGLRRPSLSAQTSSQDNTRTLGDPSQKGAVCSPRTSSQLDGLHPDTSGQEEAEEGDLSNKDKYLKKLHMQERAVEEVKLAIKPFYQRRDINKDEYKEILRKAVQKVCHSKSGEINPVKVGNLVKAYVDKYKHARKHKKEDDSGKGAEVQPESSLLSDSP